jgi:hypothetical protein
MSNANFKVAPNEVDGWDVIREGEDVALTNAATKEEAEEAARLFAEDDGGGEVDVEREPIQHGAGGTARGVKTYFVAVVGLLVAVVALIVVVALISSALNI